VCGAALCYDYPDDADAVKLQDMIRENGVEKTVQQVSGVDPASKLGNKIIEAYHDFQKKRTIWGK
jgi:mannitol-1-phosphate 5-dehydrogenase